MLTKPSCAPKLRRFLPVSLAPLALVAMMSANPVLADGSCTNHKPYNATIVSVSGDSVKLYAQPKPLPKPEPDVKQAADLINKPVKCQAKNRMLGIDLGGNKIGWLFPHKVKTNVKPVLSSRCVKDGSVNVGATRAIGEGCK